MDRHTFKATRLLGQGLAPLFRPDNNLMDPKKEGRTSYPHDTGYSQPVYTLWQQIRYVRKLSRMGIPAKEPPIRKTDKGGYSHTAECTAIRNNINGLLGTRATDVEVHIGKHEPMAHKTPKKDRAYSRHAHGPLIEVWVGHMWRRRVYNIFYAKEASSLKDHIWFILSATEVRVNRKNQLRLFEAKLYNRTTNECRNGYVVKTTIGKELADIAFNAPLAIEKGLEILSDAVKERLIQNKED